MFTGIIEAVGTLKEARKDGDNLLMTVSSGISAELALDQSLSHNGACLTVAGLEKGAHRVVAVAETLEKTNLGQLKTGDLINLERALKLGDRLDGHLVQGHIDCKATCIAVTVKSGSREYRFSFPELFINLVIEKGSVCVNGISLTAFDVRDHEFSVAIIPYTFVNTNVNDWQTRGVVNIEFDLIGKYILGQTQRAQAEKMTRN